MIKSVTVTNYLGDQITLELERPEASGFIVESIEGLGPGKATINTTEISTNDGSLFNSSRISSRNIVISLRFLFKDTIEDVRQLSYKYFPLKKKVTLLIRTDNRLAEIEGYVESNEPNIFSKEERADISIICPYPFFYEYGSQITIFNGVEPMFEFPFSNESLSENMLIMGEIQNKEDNPIWYDGDIETGVVITIHAVGDATNVEIHDILKRQVMRIDTDKLAALTGYGIVAGDDIIINTNPGQKSVTLLREGDRINILNCMDRHTDWFKLSKGENIFAYTAETGATNLQFQIENRMVYEGV